MLTMHDIKAAELNEQMLQNIISLEKDINQQGQREVYLLAFEKK